MGGLSQKLVGLDIRLAAQYVCEIRRDEVLGSIFSTIGVTTFRLKFNAAGFSGLCCFNGLFVELRSMCPSFET